MATARGADRTGQPELVALRHGQTAWSLAGRHTGRSDVPLTAEGRRQAVLAGRRLQGRQFALVLCSPLQRARETCTLSGLAASPTLDPDLAEWDYGAYDGLTSAEVAAENPGWSLWRDGGPGGERPHEVGHRADAVITRCLAARGDVALVAHGHILRVLAARWLGLGVATGALLVLDTASISTLGWEHDRRVIRCWNDTAHLQASES